MQPQLPRQQRKRSPIVFFQGGDPVRAGLVASLNRPGGNLTGFTRLGADIASKRFSLLHDLVPRASLIGALFDADTRDATTLQENEISTTARGLGLVVKEIKLSVSASQAEWDNAFASLAMDGVGALFVAASANFAFNVMDRLVQLSARYGIPTIYEARVYCEIGGLMSYGASIPDIFREIGLYAGRILKGEKAAELPVQLATKFELVINLRTARALGIEVPPTLLAIADEVIE
jgi:putative tryptophan/tyrosine transport system substrate-binding protein